MKQSVDIDVLLADNQLELTMGGKKYQIKDIDLETFMKAMKIAPDEADPLGGFRILHQQLATIFDCDVKNLNGVGLKSAALAMQTIRDWILGSEGEADQTGSPLT